MIIIQLEQTLHQLLMPLDFNGLTFNSYKSVIDISGPVCTKLQSGA